MPLSRDRMFQSYVNEFCGMVSASARGGVLASHTLRFSLGTQQGAGGRSNSSRGDIMINPCKIVNFPCHVRVWHSLDFHSQGKQNSSSPRVQDSGSLKAAMRSMFHNGFCSDLVLVFGGRRFNVHRAILVARSPKFQKMISTGNSEIQFPNVSIG